MNYYYLCFLECVYVLKADQKVALDPSWKLKDITIDKCYPTTYGLTESGCNHLNVFPTEELP